MKLNELKGFSSEDRNNDKNRVLTRDRINMMYKYYRKILMVIDKYLKSDNQEDMEIYMDAITMNFNNYIQVFMDLVTVIQLHSKDRGLLSEALWAYVDYYEKSNLCTSFDEKEVLRFLLKRNYLIHQYENYDELTFDLTNKLVSYENGMLDIVKHLESRISELSLLDFVLK